MIYTLSPQTAKKAINNTIKWFYLQWFGKRESVIKYNVLTTCNKHYNLIKRIMHF